MKSESIKIKIKTNYHSLTKKELVIANYILSYLKKYRK